VTTAFDIDGLPPLDGRSDLQAIESVSLDSRVLARTTWEVVDRAADRFGTRAAMTWVPDPAHPERELSQSFDELRSAVRSYANVYVGLGLSRGEAVAFLSPNVSTLPPAVLGAQAVGVAAPMNAAFEADRISHLFELTGARVVVAAGPELDEARWERLRSWARRLGVSAILAVRPDSATGPAPALGHARGVNILYLEDAARSGPSGTLPGAPPSPRDPAAYFHTGGTTGSPKVAVHTHENQSFMAWSIAAATGLRPDDAILAGLPMFHVNGLLVTGLAPLVAGARSVWPGPLGWRDPALLRNTWRLIERYGITAMSAVPTVYAQLAATEVDADISTLRTPIVGAAPLPRSVAVGFERRTGVPLQEGYGLTEAGCASSFTPRGSSRPDSVGQRMPYQRVAAAALDDDHVRILPPGETGEIVIAGPAVFAGYVRIVDGRRRVDRGDVVDGWLRTGDLGAVDGDDRVWIRGRRKDLIIRGGHNIEPSVIEDALLAHPRVRAVAAVGRPDQHSGEVPVAFVVLDSDEPIDDLVGWAAGQIADPASRPLAVEVLPELPLTALGKPFKPALRAITVGHVVRRLLDDEGRGEVAVTARATDSGIRIEVDGDGDLIGRVRDHLQGYALALEVVRAAR
jgi:fatty-acyl-CoA synthase